jgi:tetratricopeptide (TPR) repeat protein
MKNTLAKMFDFLLRHKFILITVFIIIVLVIGGIFLFSTIQKNAWDKAESYYKEADYIKTAEELKNVSFPKTAERLKIYASTMYAVKDYDQSLEAYEELYKLNKDPDALNMIGNIYNQKGDYEKSISNYRELITSYPNYIKGYVNLSTVYRLKGDTNNAIVVAKEGMVNNPTNSELQVLLISILSSDEDMKSSDDYKEAISKLKKFDPNNPLLMQIEE